MKKTLFIALMLLSCIRVYSQNISLNNNFNVQIREDEGDLNKDGLIDRVIVSMDTINETRPLRLQIFFSQPDGKFKLMVSSTKIIEAQYPIEKKGKHNGHQIPDFFIENGDLHMECYIKGQSVHKFRFKNGNFELVHFSNVFWDGINTTTETKFNLLTGRFIKQSQLLGSDEIFGKTEKTISIRPLPKIQNFRPFENELY